jgi:hypothetical protein
MDLKKGILLAWFFWWHICKIYRTDSANPDSNNLSFMDESLASRSVSLFYFPSHYELYL